MALSVRSCTSYDESLDLACRAAHNAVMAYGRAVVLAPDYSRQVVVKKTLAERGFGFGVQVETVTSFTVDLWELYGTGEQVVAMHERELLLRNLVRQRQEELEESVFAETDGIIGMLSDLACDCLPAIIALADEAASLSAAENEIVFLLKRYAQIIHKEGLIEPSQIVSYLTAGGFAAALPVVVWNCSATALQDALFDTALTCEVFSIVCCEKTEAPRAFELEQLSTALYRPDFSAPLKAEGSVRFALPAGRYSSAEVLAQMIAACVQRLDANADGRITVALACRNPYDTFVELAPRLRARGMAVQVEDRVPLSRTAFGIAWASLLHFFDDARHATVACSSDYALSLFSFMDKRAAYSLDARMRRWRGENLDEALTDLYAYSQEEHRDFLRAMEEGRLSDALALQHDWIASRHRWPEAFRSLQLAAVEFAQMTHGKAREWGFSDQSALAVMNTHTVMYRAQVLPEGCACEDDAVVMVRLFTQHALSAAAPASYDACVLADLSADAYPLTDEPRATDALLQKAGVFKERRTVERARADFSCAVASARNELVLHRCLNTVEAEEERPSALLDELIDCYRCDPQNAAELHKVLGLPERLVPFALTLGEERMAHLSYDKGVLPDEIGSFPLGASGELVRWAQSPEVLLAPKKGAAEHGWGGHLSASAIETYLECPYKWFATRRIGTDALDAQLGPREKGNFAHKVLQYFHDYVHDQGLLRVTPENVEEVLPAFDRLFSNLLEQERVVPSADAYFPLNNFEELEVERFRGQLRAFLRWEAALLPSYHPLKAELGFGKPELEQEPFEYAGVTLVGSIDRVDVDDFGRAVVLDYKGSVGPKYEFRVKDAEGLALPQKVQALIYAQVVRRQLGLTPVGSLYVSYGSRLGCAGLYDETLLSPGSDLLNIKPACCGSSRFLDDLDWVEEEIARRLENLVAGAIDPSPQACAHGGCDYCGVALSCPLRGGAR